MTSDPGDTAQRPVRDIDWRLNEPDVPDTPPAEAAAGSDAVTDPPPVDSGGKPRKRRPFWVELPALVAVALVVAVVIKTFLIQAFFIPSGSMRDTLVENDRVMVNKLAYRFGDPQRGHVIVFDSPLHQSNDGENPLQAVVRNVAEALGLSTPESVLIKRVIAVGGETIEIRDNRVLIDGIPIDEPYLRPGVRMADFGPVSVPAGHVFVLGDNRAQSEDSRRFGPVPESDVIGRAFVRVWPPSRWGGI